VAEAEASAVALQAKLRELNTTGAPAEVAGEFDARTDKPLLRISRRHHGNIKSSVITQDFVHGADYAAWPKPPKPSVACWAKAPRSCAAKAKSKKKKKWATSARP
jgi:DNA gyrase subunit B